MEGTIDILMYGRSYLEEHIKRELENKRFVVNLKCVEDTNKFYDLVNQEKPDALIVKFSSEDILNYKLHSIMESYSDKDKPVCVLSDKTPHEFSCYGIDYSYTEYFHILDLDCEELARELLSKKEPIINREEPITLRSMLCNT